SWKSSENEGPSAPSTGAVHPSRPGLERTRREPEGRTGPIDLGLGEDARSRLGLTHLFREGDELRGRATIRAALAARDPLVVAACGDPRGLGRGVPPAAGTDDREDLVLDLARERDRALRTPALVPFHFVSPLHLQL